MRLTSGRLSLLLVLISTPALVSQQRRDPASGLLVGQVIDAATSRPLSGAVVNLSGPSAPGAPHPRILTGADGRFVFRNLPRGSYSLTATRNGFTDGAYGRLRPAGPSLPLPVAEGERIGDITVRMWKHAAISGTVVDESGERQVLVPVTAYRRTIAAGRRRFVAARTMPTDDRGVFRLGSLIPGDYIVGTSNRYAALPTVLGRETEASSGGSRPGEALIPVGEGSLMIGRGTPMPPPGGRGLSIYPPSYYPTSTGAESATVVTIRSGEEYESADIHIAPVQTVSVSGMIVGPDGPLSMTPVRLVSGAAPESLLQSEFLTAQTDRAGRFTFPAVPSGHYALRMTRGQATSSAREFGATSSLLWADVPVAVGSEHISDLAVTALAGLRIRGRIEFAGTSMARAASSVQVLIEPVDPPGGAPVNPVVARPDPSGGFIAPGVPAGRYYVRVPNSPAGWMFLSATSNGRDVADVPLHLTDDVHDVVVTFTDRWSGIQGGVSSASGRDAGALVIVFPTDEEAWGSSGGNPRRVRSTRASKSGDYSFNLPPGDYYVAALPDEYAADWQDPDVMTSVSRTASKVTVTIGQRRVQDLRTMVVR